MKITKFNQSCLLIDTKGVRILVDPGGFGYSEERLDDWSNVDIILVTHKHGDHCNDKAINYIMKRDGSSLYTTSEVNNTYSFNDCNIVKEGDVIKTCGLSIEVVHASHGYLTGMRQRDAEVIENVGFIIDDGNKRLYTTSDSINFYNEYKCDILCMPFNGNGLTFGLVDGVDFAKEINPSLLLPIHLEHPNPVMNPSEEDLSHALNESGLNYLILKLEESIEV